MTHDIYNCLASHNIPEEIITQISFNVHRNNFAPVCSEISDLSSPVEDIILGANETITVNDALRATYPDMTIQINFPSITFFNVLIKLTSTKFVLFHQYKEHNIDEQFIIEGEVSRGFITVHKFICINYYQHNGERRNWQITDIESYFDEYPGVNNIPFEYIIQEMTPGLERIAYRKSLVYRQWNNPFGVIDKLSNLKL